MLIHKCDPDQLDKQVVRPETGIYELEKVIFTQMSHSSALFTAVKMAAVINGYIFNVEQWEEEEGAFEEH